MSHWYICYVSIVKIYRQNFINTYQENIWRIIDQGNWYEFLFKLTRMEKSYIYLVKCGLFLVNKVSPFWWNAFLGTTFCMLKDISFTEYEIISNLLSLQINYHILIYICRYMDVWQPFSINPLRQCNSIKQHETKNLSLFSSELCLGEAFFDWCKQIYLWPNSRLEN